MSGIENWLIVCIVSAGVSFFVSYPIRRKVDALQSMVSMLAKLQKGKENVQSRDNR